MGSQFVDLNGDGHVDYLSATFDGSPHVAYGSAEGFAEPVRLLDAQGERILISSFWNYDDKAHQVTGRAFGSEDPPDERCISALAFDWDGDGDHDLLLGSYENGHLYRQMNVGDDADPKFTGRLVAVTAGDAPFAIPAKMTTPRLVDWDGDGDLDLVAGSFGDSYGQGTGGGVYLSLNGGEAGAPDFGPLQTLIPPSPKGSAEPTRPDAGLYADPVDYDGDGDLDLVVGGYSMWTPPGRELSADEVATLERLRAEQQQVQSEFSALMARIAAESERATAGLEAGDPTAREKAAAVRAAHQDEITPLSTKLRGLQQQITELVPGPRREAFVWLYERRSTPERDD